MRPILPALDSTNHIAPSGPRVMSSGYASGVGTGYSLIVRSCVTTASLFATLSVNQIERSAAMLIEPGCEPCVGVRWLLSVPVRVSNSTTLDVSSVVALSNHKPLSGPSEL